MAKFEFPVKWHRFTTKEFDQKKLEYNAKYGYNINIPGFSDVFKLGLDTPPTEQELFLYKSDRPGELSTRRWQEIKALKRKKKESFLRMMSSPTPSWMMNIGSAMTFLDDANDTLGTLAVAARFTAHMLPKYLGKILLGPAGWLLTAADIANIGMTLSRLPIRAVAIKAHLHKSLAMNPFNKKARVARAAKLRSVSLSKGEAIEALQVTSNIFGVGLCLGPIVGLVQDIAFGTYRVLQGKKVTISTDWPPLAAHEAMGLNYFKAAQQLWTGGQELSDDDHARSVLAFNAAIQMAYPITKFWYSMDKISDLNNIEIQAPMPIEPLTLEILSFNHIDPRKTRGWPHLNKEWATPMELWDASESLITKSLLEYCIRNKHNQMGLMTGQTVVDSIQNMYALAEGEDQVELGYSHVETTLHKMFDNGWVFGKYTSPVQLQCFAETVERWGDEGFNPDWKYIRRRIFDLCRIRFERHKV